MMYPPSHTQPSTHISHDCCPLLPPPFPCFYWCYAAARSYHTISSTRSYSSAAQPAAAAAAADEQALPPGPAKGSDVPRINIGVFGVMNAGKSTLMNAITRQETSIVDATPGTTAGDLSVLQRGEGGKRSASSVHVRA
jgi:hypothetical protein